MTSLDISFNVWTIDLSFFKTEETIMSEVLVAPSADLIGDGSREKLAIKLTRLREDGYLSGERKIIERYARKLQGALLSLSSLKLGVGKKDLCALECDELAILAGDIFNGTRRRAMVSIACLSVIPIFGWVGLVASLCKDYDGSVYIAYWHAYKKLRVMGDKALGLAFKNMKEHNFDSWDIQ